MKKSLLIAFVFFTITYNVQAQFPCQQIEAVVNTISVEPTIISNSEIYYDICQGETISFSGTGNYPENNLHYEQNDSNVTFQWQLGNEGSIEGQNISHTFFFEGLYIIDLVITDNNGCTSSNKVNIVVRVSTHPEITISSFNDFLICPNEPTQIHTAVSVIQATVSADCENEVSELTFLPDGEFDPSGTTFSSYNTPIEFDCFSTGQELTNIDNFLRVCLEIEHSFLGDLTINLHAPNGSIVTLLPDLNNATAGNGIAGGYLGEPDESDDTGDAGIGYIYCWSPDANLGLINDYPFTGFTEILPPSDTINNTNYYAAYEALPDDLGFDNLLGTTLNGQWTIEVIDSYSSDDGFIFSWWIDFHESIMLTDFEFTPEIVEQGWLPNPIISSYTNHQLTIAGTNSGLYDLVYYVIDDFGCTYEETIQIEVAEEIQITNVTIDNKACSGTGTIQFDITGGIGDLDVVWEHGPEGFTILGDVPSGSYTVTITDEEGCSITETFLIPDEHITLDITLVEKQDDYCSKGTGTIEVATLNGEGPYTYEWYLDDELINTTATPYVANLSAGDYKLLVYDTNGCMGEFHQSIENIELLDAYFILQDEIVYVDQNISFEDLSFVHSLTEKETIHWNFGDGNSAEGSYVHHSYTQGGEYLIRLTITDTFGCTEIHEERLIVKDYTIFVPTAFSPNGDGLNDFFQPVITDDGISNYQLYIFDRWGKQVFQTNEYTTPWDGMILDKNVPAEIGVYNYKVSYTNLSNRRKERAGLLHLLK